MLQTIWAWQWFRETQYELFELLLNVFMTNVHSGDIYEDVPVPED